MIALVAICVAALVVLMVGYFAGLADGGGQVLERLRDLLGRGPRP